jgi:dihydroorotate dehydrogenase
MILRGIEFGSVWGASGVQGFFDGDEYVYHRVLKRLGLLDMRGMTFVAKTMTLDQNAGNMRVQNDGITPRELRPACVHVTPGSWWRGHALNKVGLTNPGAHTLLRRDIWQQRTAPFVLSFMQIASDPDPKRELTLKLEELLDFVRLLRDARRSFKAPIALQINFSCPNTGPHAKQTITFIHDSLDIASSLDIPIIPKLAVDTLVIDALAIAEHPAVAAICVSNTVAWGSKVEGVNWESLWGSIESPLAYLGKPGGGGLSGAPLLPLVEEWIKRFRRLDGKTPINGGGGILGPRDARRLIEAGANSIFLGSIAFLRPWRVQSTIQCATQLLERT